ncbi:RteC domain-containing protein [Chitinophaga sp. RCC_12]|uniref:RteC domain-containing protein n=1 Tax=Chitinophaga sp. RCC_12 TaxID=3239226 RepID=UPI003525F8D9
MAKDPNTLLSMLHADMKAIESNHNLSALEIADLALIKTAGHLLNLKAAIKVIPLNNVCDQILFFKKIQPEYFSALLYYHYIARLEREKVAGSYNGQVLYYQRAINQINVYLAARQPFVTYDKLKCTYLDHILFRLPPDELSVYPDNINFHYAEYFNFFSYNLAKIWAYQRLLPFLTKAATYGSAKFPRKKSKDATIQIERSKVLKVNKSQLSERDEIIRKIEWLELKTETSNNTFYAVTKKVALRKKSNRAGIEYIMSKLT